jgi:uncharacterized protein YbaA (DUF1428 family)
VTDSGPRGEEGGYVQLFVYRLRKKNRDALKTLLKEIARKLREHGALRSEFFQLHSKEAFQGFTTVATALSTLADEELWVELDYYRGRGHRDQVMAGLSKDADAGALFRRLGPLVSEGYTIAMGEFDKMNVG